MSRRWWVLGLGSVLVIGLVVGLVWWRTSDDVRADSLAGEVAAVDGVDSAGAEPRHPGGQYRLRVTMAGGSSESQVAEAVDAACTVLGDPMLEGAVIARGNTALTLGSTCWGQDEAARVLLATDGELPGQVEVDGNDRTLRLNADEGAAFALAQQAVTLVLEGALPITSVEVEVADGESDSLLVRLPEVEPAQVAALAELAAVGAEVRYAQITSYGVEVTAAVPSVEAEPVVRAAQAAGASLGEDEPPTVAVDTQDDVRVVGSDDPGAAFALIEGLARTDWQVTSISTSLRTLDVHASGIGQADPDPDLPRLDALVRDLAPQLPAEARIVATDAAGVLFGGAPADLRRLAPRWEALLAEGYQARWAADGAGTTFADDMVVEVTMPPGHSLSDDAELAAAVDATRSLGWPGTARVRIAETDDEESTNDSDPPAVVFLSTDTGTASDADSTPSAADETSRVTEAWDTTATD